MKEFFADRQSLVEKLVAGASTEVSGYWSYMGGPRSASDLKSSGHYALHPTAAAADFTVTLRQPEGEQMIRDLARVPALLRDAERSSEATDRPVFATDISVPDGYFASVSLSTNAHGKNPWIVVGLLLRERVHGGHGDLWGYFVMRPAEAAEWREILGNL